VYDSVFAPQDVRTVVEKSDCLLALGTILSDFYGAIVQKAYDRMILAAGNAVRVGSYVYPGVPLDRFVRLLVERWQHSESHQPPEGATELIAGRLQTTTPQVAAEAAEPRVTWESFFARLSGFLKKDMVLLVDTSLALFPSAEIAIGEGVRFIAQTAWLSIGYTVGAAVGVSMIHPRPVAIVGDGGFQMIPQAFSTLVRNKKPAILFVLDNQVYGIEQYLVDQQILLPNERFYGNENTQPSFFDVLPKWDYVKLAEAFGGKGYLVTNEAELHRVLHEIEKQDVPVLVAVQLEPRSLPPEIAASLCQPTLEAMEVLPRSQSKSSVAQAAFN
jgi:indolepyruvate decarboxylase